LPAERPIARRTLLERCRMAAARLRRLRDESSERRRALRGSPRLRRSTHGSVICVGSTTIPRSPRVRFRYRHSKVWLVRPKFCLERTILSAAGGDGRCAPAVRARGERTSRHRSKQHSSDLPGPHQLRKICEDDYSTFLIAVTAAPWRRPCIRAPLVRRRIRCADG